MDATTTSRAHDTHYRDIANELRLIVLKMKQAEAAEELRLLAIRYEGLAVHARTSAAASHPPDMQLRLAPASQT